MSLTSPDESYHENYFRTIKDRLKKLYAVTGITLCLSKLHVM